MNDRQKKIILEALDNPDELDSWEYDFINDLADKPKNIILSDRTNAVLDSIAKKLDLE